MPKKVLPKQPEHRMKKRDRRQRHLRRPSLPRVTTNALGIIQLLEEGPTYNRITKQGAHKWTKWMQRELDSRGDDSELDTIWARSALIIRASLVVFKRSVEPGHTRHHLIDRTIAELDSLELPIEVLQGGEYHRYG